MCNIWKLKNLFNYWTQQDEWWRNLKGWFCNLFIFYPIFNKFESQIICLKLSCIIIRANLMFIWMQILSKKRVLWFNQILYPIVLGYKNTIMLSYTFEKARLVCHVVIITGQCILMEMDVETVIKLFNSWQ